jgi:proline dehydrogenase
MIPPVASNFVAGETASEAIEHARELERRGIGTILNLLGEHYEDPADAAADTAAYGNVVERLAGVDADACVSVKPSQVGLDVSRELFRENLASIVGVADEHGTFVWVDMEDHTTTDATLDAFEFHAEETDGNVGVCVQSNLKRTREDLERLADLPGKARLVKGAYDPPYEIAYQRKERVDRAYREDLEFLFREFDGGVAVGSHDPAMLDHARELHDRYGTDFEVQMLMGVREAAQTDLAREYPVYQYVPYGRKWFSYFYRRVRERRRNALFALRALVGR